MDFTNRGASQPAPVRAASAGQSNGGKRDGHWKDSPMWLRMVWMALLFCGTILAVAMVTLLYFGGPDESKHVDQTKQQAVFLTNGQVYFGKVKAINDKFVDLRGIFYLNVDQQVQPKDNKDATSAQNSVKLVKLGCELHSPADKMIINREQISFWENLKDDGQVAKAIAEWVKANPNGQDCTAAAKTDTTTP